MGGNRRLGMSIRPGSPNPSPDCLIARETPLSISFGMRPCLRASSMAWSRHGFAVMGPILRLITARPALTASSHPSSVLGRAALGLFIHA